LLVDRRVPFNWRILDTFLVALIALATTAVRLPTLVEPWGGDQGVFGYIAKSMLDGKVPYSEVYTSTGYGILFAYAGFFKVFGQNMAAIHIGDLIAWIVAGCSIFLLAKLLYGREVAVIAGFMAIIIGSGRAFSGMVDMKGAWGTYWQLAQRESFMMPLLIGAVLLVILAIYKKNAYLGLCSGALVGLAAVFKWTVVLMLAVIMAYEIASAAGERWRRLRHSLPMISATLLGFVVANIPFLAYFWHHHSLGNMFRAVFIHTSIYAKLTWGNIVADALRGNTYFLGEDLFASLLAVGALLYFVSKRTASKENYLMCGWMLVTLWMVWGQGKFFGYHYIVLVGPFTILAGFSIRQFLKTMPTWKESILSSRKDIGQLILWAMMAGSIGAFAWGSYEYYRWHALYLSGSISQQTYYEVFNEYPLHLYSFRANREVAEYLKANAPPGATFRDINGGGETVVNFLTGMKTVTRFSSTWYLFSKQLYSDALTTQLRQEFIEGVKTEKPAYILLVYYTADEFRKEYSRREQRDVWNLLDYVEQNYIQEKVFRDGRVLYKRI
jgi:hypothetical protein